MVVFKTDRSPFASRSVFRRSNRSSFGTPRSARQHQRKKNSHIKVCVRLRPITPAESSFPDCREVVRVLDENVLIFDPIEAQAPTYYKGRVIRDPTARRNKDLKFGFDAVFDTSATNQDVYEHTTKFAIEKLLEGVNSSVFAYGATGAGKTYTMLGTPQQPGVIFRTMQELYERIESMEDDVVCDVQVCYLEIYNENVRDLLKPESGVLPLREDDQGLTVSNLSFHKPDNADHLLEMLDFGNRNRSQHPTDANKESSRSHAVFQVFLEQRPRTADLAADFLVSKMSLIDLAGSERATATKNCGERFREGANINRSLLALGNCINALAEGRRGAHIPYRDSKLTRILKDSLGGNCQTVMIANVSPCALCYEDTYNTLKYADRAKQIKAEVKKNVLHVDYHIHQYSKIVQELQMEIGEVKSKNRRLREENQRLVDRNEILELRTKSGDGIITKFLEEIQPLIKSYVSLQSKLLHNESQYRLQQLRLDERERIQEHLETVQFDQMKLGKDTCRTERIRKQCRVRQADLLSKVEKLQEGVEQLRLVLLDSVCSLISDTAQTSESSGNVLNALAGKEIVETQLRSELGHLQEVIKQESIVATNQKKLLEAVLSLAKEQHLIISGYDRMTPKLQSELDNVIRLVQGIKEVAWSDDDEQKVAFSLDPLPTLTLEFVAGPNTHLLEDNNKGLLNSLPENVSASSAKAVKNLQLCQAGSSKEMDREVMCTEEGKGIPMEYDGLPDLPAADETFVLTPLPSSPSERISARVNKRVRSPPPPMAVDVETDENFCVNALRFNPTFSSSPFSCRTEQQTSDISPLKEVGNTFYVPSAPKKSIESISENLAVPIREGISKENSVSVQENSVKSGRSSSDSEKFKKPAVPPPLAGKKKTPVGLLAASCATAPGLKRNIRINSKWNGNTQVFQTPSWPKENLQKRDFGLKRTHSSSRFT